MFLLKNIIYICNVLKQKGRLAQLVQSIWFTPRGSGVRIPHRPLKDLLNSKSFFVYLHNQKL